MLVAFPVSPMKALHIGEGGSDPRSLESGLGGIRGRALHSARRLGSLLRAAGTGRKERVRDDSFGGQEIIRTIY